MTKAELRKVYLQKRLALSVEEFQSLNERIIDNLFQGIDFSNVHVLHTFLPIEKTKEVDTWQIIERLHRTNPILKVAIPKINAETATLDNFYLEEKAQLETNTWGIPEPKYGVPVTNDSIEIILVPLLVADKLGNRVGYGRGFYDKFLVQCKSTSLKIGLSLFAPTDVIEDVNEFDQKLTHLVTPDTVIKF